MVTAKASIQALRKQTTSAGNEEVLYFTAIYLAFQSITTIINLASFFMGGHMDVLTADAPAMQLQNFFEIAKC